VKIKLHAFLIYVLDEGSDPAALLPKEQEWKLFTQAQGWNTSLT
jgi:hypothetical protein